MIFNTKKKAEEPASAAAHPPASTPAAAAAGKPLHDPRSGAAPGPQRQTPEEAKAGRGSLDPSLGRTSPKISRTSAAHASYLNPHLSFEGNLKYTGTVTIDCDFRGSITTDDTLVVGPTAKVHAEVTAGVLEISGKVEGNVRAKTRVKIYTGGQVVGNIETPTISMEEGVVFEGSCTRPAHQHASQSHASQSQDVQRMLATAEEVLAGST
ncbi:MAG TPA: polymer-forming cytoskeletal protein [Planctomycetota bacterium]|nr:polymer-forming cytoskeletal protein [Planctomycetota bacterium]